MSRKYKDYDPGMDKLGSASSEDHVNVTKTESIPDLPTIKAGDKVTITDATYKVNGTAYTGALVENSSESIIKSSEFDITVDGKKVTCYFWYRTSYHIAFKNYLTTNPSKTMNYLTLSYSGRVATIDGVTVFFVSEVVGDSSKDSAKLKATAYVRNSSNEVIILSSLPKSLVNKDSGYRNKLAYLLYDDAAGKASSIDGVLSDTETSYTEVTDTYKDKKTTKAEEFMRKKLLEWGIESDATGQELIDQYERVRQDHIVKEEDAKKKSGRIVPNPQTRLTPPVITHNPLPESGFRRYGGKILLVTLIASGVVLYRQLHARSGSIENKKNGLAEAAEM